MTHKLYNDTVALEFDEKTHIYSLDGKRIDGVTSALSIIAKPALVYWAVGEAVKVLERSIKPGVSYDEIQLKNLLGNAKGSHRRVSDEAATMGSMIHQWIEDYISGKNPPMPVNNKIKSSVEQFLKWVGEYQVKFLKSENLVYSKVGNYAGTFDFIAEIGGKKYIGDFKSSSGIWDEYWLQVAAYQQAYLEEFPTETIDGAMIVRLGKNNQLEVKTSEDYTKNVIAFNHALELYRRMMEFKQDVRM